MTNENLTQWAKEENEKLVNERATKLKEKGYRDFYAWKKGENRFEIDIKEPKREIEGKYGKQMIFVAKANGTIFDLAVNVRSPIYKIIVGGLAKGQTIFNILKSGEGKETRYEELG